MTLVIAPISWLTLDRFVLFRSAADFIISATVAPNLALVLRTKLLVRNAFCLFLDGHRKSKMHETGDRTWIVGDQSCLTKKVKHLLKSWLVAFYHSKSHVNHLLKVLTECDVKKVKWYSVKHTFNTNTRLNTSAPQFLKKTHLGACVCIASCVCVFAFCFT